MDAIAINPNSVRDLSPEVLDGSGRPRVLPAAYYQGTSAAERGLFGVRHGIYGFPTLELVDWIKATINGRSAIEIGAGPGVLAAALGIPATDSFLQEDPAIAAHYASLGQALVPYGDNVERLDAAAALDKYKPQVVVASWVTHLYNPERHSAGGNVFGVDEDALLDACEAYIFVGNTRVHAGKTIWSRPHHKLVPTWVFSRSLNGSPDFVALWGE